MGRPFILTHDEIQSSDCIFCRACKCRVAFIEDHIAIGVKMPTLEPGGIFNNMFNVEVPEEEPYHEVVDGNTRADAYCVKCGNLLGWKLIAVSQPSRYFKEGRFVMKLDELTYCNDVTLLQLYEERVGGANEQAPNDEDVGANLQAPNDEDVGANEQAPNDEDVGANQQAPNDEDVGANEQAPIDEDVGANQQAPNDEDVGANEQAPNDEDAGANERAPNDEDVGANERAPNDEDVGANEQAPNDEDVGANEQIPNDQDLGANEQNDDQDGGANEQVPNEQVRGEILSHDYIHCRFCRSTRVAFVEDYIPDVTDLPDGGFFNRLFNVEVTEDERYHQVIEGNTRAHVHCLQCRMLIGWKLIAVPRPTRNCREGRFCMRLDKLIYWDNETLLHFLFRTGGANEQAPDDQDGGADEQDHDQDVEANEQDHDHDVGADAQGPNDQDGGANEQGPNDHDGGANEQGPNDHDGGTNEQNADQDGVANEQILNEQDVVANQQNVDQDGVGNEQNHDEDGGAPMN